MSLFRNLTEQAKEALKAVRAIVVGTKQQIESAVQGLHQQLLGAARSKPDPRTAAANTLKDVRHAAEAARDQIRARAQEAADHAKQIAEWGTGRVERLADRAGREVQGLVSDLATGIIAETGEFTTKLTRTFDAARSWGTGVLDNVNNVRQTAYLNVGNWDEDNSDFALVCGPCVALCSWLDCQARGKSLPAPDRTKSPRREALQRLSRFLKPTAMARPSLRDFYDAPAPLTQENELLVFVGDLHINLLRECSCDNFVRPDGDELVSLLPMFEAFLTHAKGQGVGADHIIQTGDCLDVWEAQAVMHAACEEYVKHSLAPGPHSVEYRRLRTLVQQLGLKVWDQPPTSAAAREEFYQHATPALAVAMLGVEYPARLDARPAFRQHIDFLNPATAEATIRAMNADENLWRRLTILRGNHDNGVANRWLDRKYGRTSLSVVDRATPYEPTRFGKAGCIAVEHGEAADEFNRRSSFDEGTHGFALTYLNAAELELAGVHGGGSGPVTRATIAVTHQRFVELAFGQNFNESGRVRLVVLGHSHDADLKRWEDFKLRKTIQDVKYGVLAHAAAGPMGDVPTEALPAGVHTLLDVKHVVDHG